MPNIRILILNSPNFQLVRSMLSTRPVLTGSSEKIIRAMMSRSRTYLAKNLLEPSETGIPVHVRGHRTSQFMKTDGLHNTECVEQQRHKFYARQIHTLFKVLLHNREDLVNFDQVLGISSFHGEKSPNFSFKLLNFRDFCKFNRLKIRCLTA